ncbi:MAG: hypothetical protein WAK01_15000 [Methylocystis sp.]
MRHFARLALVVACAAWGASAKAAVVDIITVSNFQSTASGFLQSAITNVTGYFTTTPGQPSNLTVTEYAGQTFTYHFTTPDLGGGWTQPTQIGSSYTASPTASFGFGLHAGSGPVWNNVEVVLTEGVFNVGGGTVTLTESLPGRRPARASQGSPSCLSRVRRDGRGDCGRNKARRHSRRGVLP